MQENMVTVMMMMYLVTWVTMGPTTVMFAFYPSLQG